MPQKPNREMNFRTLNLRLSKDGGGPSTLDNENRSFEVVGATEAPVEVYDWRRGELVKEILLMSGCEMPNGRQVPLLDSHMRWDTASVLGSFREMRAVKDQLIGRVFFATAPEAESPYIKAREGHLTDFSVGYRVIDSQWVPEGEKTAIQGRSFEGPVSVVTRWRVKELSICPIGADEAAKARSEKLINKGVKHLMELQNNTTTEQIEAVRQEERERIVGIEFLCRRAKMEHLKDEFVRNGATIEMVRQRAMDYIFTNAEGGHGYRGPVDIDHFYHGQDESDKRREAAIDGLCLRAGVKLPQPASGALDYRGVALADIAKECLVSAGVSVRGKTRAMIVKMALSERAAGGWDFPSLLSAAAGKALRTAYEQSPATYEQWVNITDGLDFKEMSRHQLSEADDIDQVPELGPYKYGEFGESKEVFRIYKFGKLFAVSREAIINDDLSAFTRIPLSFALSARRKVNQACYDILTANAAMSDGLALFHASHSNLAAPASVAPPTVVSLSAARLAMRKQAGLKDAVLNIAPKFLIAPAAHETQVDELLNSIGSLTENKNEGVVNPFYNKLEPVIESYLDASSATAWYLAADPKNVDTVELCFLDGRREPYLETKDGWQVDGTEFKVRIEFGVKAIDWRGLYKNPGA
jgi:hypothetical protein